MDLNDIQNTKVKQPVGWKNIAISSESKDKINANWKELNRTKDKFVALAISKLINEYERKQDE